MTEDAGVAEGTGGSSSATPATIHDEMPAKSARAQSYNELYNLARLTTNTMMIPRPLRGRPDEAFSVMVYGAELGLEPFAALRSIYIVDGQPTCSAQLMRGLIQAAGHVLQWRTVTTDRVVLYGRRRDTGADALVIWTLEDAKRAKLLGKGNWATYPRAMLAARATSELARLLFADVLHGIAYTPEEVGAVGPYSAIDVDFEPPVTPGDDTGEILIGEDSFQQEEISDDTPPDEVEMVDAADAMEAVRRYEARRERDTQDQAAARAEQQDLLEDEP